MRQAAEVVVVGAGIMGLSVAYNLARQHGIRAVTVVDQGYLCGGASGRNGGGLRAQWSNETSIRWMQESLKLCRAFAREHRINTWFRQGGYLFLARTEKSVATLEQSALLQRRHGLATRMLAPSRLTRIVPELSTKGVLAGCFNPDDAVVFPWPFVWGYAEGARELGVEIHDFTKVVALETQGRAIQAVVTDRGTIRTSIVVNAAGAQSPEVARLANIVIPTRPQRHEICSTEPLKPWLTPLVADLSDGLYFSQSTRGELVGGVGNERVQENPSQRSSARFLALYSRALLRTCPLLSSVKILRQWAGYYDISPDRNPILGSVDDLDGFFLTSGFMGHGFMMAPIVGKLIAELIAKDMPSAALEPYNLRRFKSGQLLDETMIIG